MAFARSKAPQPDLSTTKFLSPAEVAERLGISRRTVDRFIASGELRAHRFGKLVRIAENEVLTFVRRHPIGRV